MLLNEHNAFDLADETLRLRVINAAKSICISIKLDDYNQSFFFVGITNDLATSIQQHDKKFKSYCVYDFDYQDKEFVKALEAYMVNKYDFIGDNDGVSEDSTILYVLRIY